MYYKNNTLNNLPHYIELWPDAHKDHDYNVI